MVAFVYAGMDMNDSIQPDYIHSVTAAFEKVDSTSNMGFSWDASWLGMRADYIAFSSTFTTSTIPMRPQ